MRVTSAGLGFFTAAVVVALALAVPASAGPLSASAPLDITAGDPYAGCPPIGAGVNYPDAEVEPFVAVNPVNPANIVAVYQQDRYSNGGSKGTVSSASFNGGLTWLQRPVPADTVCTGGKYDRASDPWITFGPDGVAHSMSLVTDADPPAGFGDNGMAYNRSTDGGLTWEPAQLLIEDTEPRFLNDKNSMTADPNDADFVYAVWDRLQNANADTKLGPAENRVGLGFKGPIYFARTTNGGDSWEPARKIWESGANKQALGRSDRGAARDPRRRRARLLHRVPQRVRSRRSLPALAVADPVDRQGRLVGQGGARRHRVPRLDPGRARRGQHDRRRAGAVPRPDRDRQLPDPLR